MIGIKGGAARFPRTSRMPAAEPGGVAAPGMGNAVRLLVSLGFLVMLLADPGAAWARNGKAAARAGGVAYQVSIVGVDDARIRDLLLSVSTCVELSGKPAGSIFQLRARARADVDRLQDALRSQGMLAATVSWSLDEKVAPVMVRFTVSSIEPFLLDTVAVKTAEGAPPPGFELPQGSELGLVTGKPAVSKDIVAGAEKLLETLRDKGHPFPVLVKQQVVADYRTRLVQVTYVVDPGPYARFGPVEFTGLKDVEESFLSPLIPWKEGDPYRAELVGTFQARLLDLGLFSTAEVAPEKDLDAEGRVVVAAKVTERKKRTIKAGIDYKTDEGPGVNLMWEHRNLFGRGEKLHLNLAVSQINQTLEASFEKPSFLDPRQKLLASFKAGGQNTQAYRGQNAVLQAGVDRKLSDHLNVSAGLGFRESRIEEDAANPMESNKRWGLAFIPLEASLNTRDDPLNPTKGYLLGVKLAPYLDTQGHNLNFLKAELNGTTYLDLLAKPSVILALRAGLGAIDGAQAKDIPPDVRFYAGGSATVRGYAYQTVGPLRGTKPLGGDSVFDFGSELRVQVTELIGLAVFLDGGNVFDKQFPDLSGGLLYGAGVGVRVKSPIGPLRVDVATPLERREKVDAPVQLYISIGQAF